MFDSSSSCGYGSANGRQANLQEHLHGHLQEHLQALFLTPTTQAARLPLCPVAIRGPRTHKSLFPRGSCCIISLHQVSPAQPSPAGPLSSVFKGAPNGVVSGSLFLLLCALLTFPQPRRRNDAYGHLDDLRPARLNRPSHICYLQPKPIPSPLIPPPPRASLP